jgi:hypothetical protein
MDRHTSLDISNIPKELLLILEIIKYNKDVENKNLSTWTNEVDWNIFLELALHHRVYPILYTQIKLIEDNLIPPNIAEKLYQYYRRNTFQMLYLSAEMEQVSRICSDHLIRILFLKGPVLALDLYGDISYRTSSDLDILVSIHDLQKVEELLMKSGYEKDDYIETILGDWKWRHHHITYYHSGKKIKIEIHWRLNPGPGKEPSFADLWERRRTTFTLKYPISYLGLEDLFLFLVCHGARHGWSRLRWLKDVDQIVRKDINWSKLTQLFKKYNSYQVGGQAMILSSQLINTQLPQEIKELFSGPRPRQLAQEAIFYLERMVNLHSEPVPEEVEKFHKSHLLSLMSIRQRLLFFMSYLYPYSKDAETLPLPKYLHFLYFPLRPFIWAWRKTRNHALP